MTYPAAIGVSASRLCADERTPAGSQTYCAPPHGLFSAQRRRMSLPTSKACHHRSSVSIYVPVPFILGVTIEGSDTVLPTPVAVIYPKGIVRCE